MVCDILLMAPKLFLHLAQSMQGEESILALSTIDAKRRNNSCNLRCGDNKVINQSTTQLMQGEEIIPARSTKGEL